MSKTPHTGMTRTTVASNHALICPESHVPISMPTWANATAVVLISPEMGAKFTQWLVHCQANARIDPLRATDETFVLVLAGEAVISFEGESWRLNAEDFVALPAATAWQITSRADADLLVFSKPYIDAGHSPPEPLRGCLDDVPAEPFLGDPAALLKVLLPDEKAFDWGINVFEFAPGGTLPQVESHFMEHGLYLLAGEGVYRLGENWYPVTAGDAIWMGAYLPQWFAATGKHNTRYIYYKEMQRAPIAP